jgi:hypothetical protein
MRPDAWLRPTRVAPPLAIAYDAAMHDWNAVFAHMATTQEGARATARRFGIHAGTMSSAVHREQSLPGRGRLASWGGGITPAPAATLVCPSCAASIVLEVTRG